MPRLLCLTLLLLPQAVNAQEVAKDVLKHIRAVSVSIEAGGRTIGSGTIFHKEGEAYCLTALHVAASAEAGPLRVCQHQDGKVVAVYAAVHSKNEENDYAVLRLGKGVFQVGAKLTCRKHGLDTAIVHCGSMRGQDHSVTRGHINGLDRNCNGHKRDQADITADFGSSGGGVFTTQGELIGLVTEGYPQRIVFFVPIRHLEGLQ